MSFADPTHSRILAETINALEKAERNSLDPNGRDTPPIFRETAKHIPSLLAYFGKCKQQLNETMMTEELPQSTIDAMEICEGNATRVNEIFSGVVGSSNAVEQYRKVARGDQLEVLMKEILENAIKISEIRQLAVIRGVEVQKLSTALGRFTEMSASSPEVQSPYSFYNSGNGHQNINTSTGHQYNNSGPGNMFTGVIHGFQMSK
ncbi:uncharacterized protein N7479_002871 [Penicillium vulpinum]|uniref:NACHT-NTPase and P-loop NTPases N-terminal domain-containing protein n=1 Tax=Penicillium vulpinum TaxID=29845 RepID=A0A1V6RSF4_9EURO|nr:uncharacterized protein N7479_002871 [Penicillium vulpinum]KAJ5972953.1 hypothetical protein N7479_002871 [Penicillium vulpinum]OQE04711.1 hypothetical protein PENVUL_c030G05968 [Penicillium vulpinum]